jgi:pantothenate synthetase
MVAVGELDQERADLGGDTLAAAVRVGSTRLIDNVLLDV